MCVGGGGGEERVSRDGVGADRRAGMEWKLRGARVVGKDTVGVIMRTGGESM